MSQGKCGCRISTITGLAFESPTIEYCRTHAAAPDMLEALKECKAALRGAREMLKDIAPIEYALDLSEAVIGKATP